MKTPGKLQKGPKTPRGNRTVFQRRAVKLRWCIWTDLFRTLYQRNTWMIFWDGWSVYFNVRWEDSVGRTTLVTTKGCSVRYILGLVISHFYSRSFNGISASVSKTYATSIPVALKPLPAVWSKHVTSHKLFLVVVFILGRLGESYPGNVTGLWLPEIFSFIQLSPGLVRWNSLRGMFGEILRIFAMGCNGDVLGKTNLWLDTIFLFLFLLLSWIIFSQKKMFKARWL